MTGQTHKGECHKIPIYVLFLELADSQTVQTGGCWETREGVAARAEREQHCRQTLKSHVSCPDVLMPGDVTLEIRGLARPGIVLYTCNPSSTWEVEEER